MGMPVVDDSAVVERLDHEVRERVRRDGVDPQRDSAVVRRIAEAVVRDHDERSLTGAVVALADPAAIVGELVERMLKSSGRRVDISQPFVDALLPGGHRLHVVLEGITRGFSAVNIRKFVVKAAQLDELVRLGSLTVDAARFLDAAVVAGLNIVVSGGT